MNIVFLRGAVPPQNENPEKLLYDSIEECEDMWTQLFYALTQKLNANGMLIYHNGDKVVRVSDFFMERWVPDLKRYMVPFSPDMIVCRGGFDYYEPFIARYPHAKKVYYGAGRRFFPQHGFTDYDLFLADSENQRERIRNLKDGAKVKLLIKPAARLFEPKKVEKKHDVCFIANGVQSAFKGHKLVIKGMVNSGLSILNLGNKDPNMVELSKNLGANIEWGGWSLRKFLPERISECKVGIVCSDPSSSRGNVDSAPRVLPEYLACGLPVVIPDDIHFWKEKYITKETGLCVPRESFFGAINKAVNSYESFNPRGYYERELSVDVASDYLASVFVRMGILVK